MLSGRNFDPTARRSKRGRGRADSKCFGLAEPSPARGIRTIADNITRKSSTLGRLALFTGILHITEKCESLKCFTPVSGWRIRRIAHGIFDFCR